MTDQITDKVLYGGQEYDLVGIFNKGIFLDVDTLGIKTETFTTNNYRGLMFRSALKEKQ